MLFVSFPSSGPPLRIVCVPLFYFGCRLPFCSSSFVILWFGFLFHSLLVLFVVIFVLTSTSMLIWLISSSLYSTFFQFSFFPHPSLRFYIFSPRLAFCCARSCFFPVLFLFIFYLCLFLCHVPSYVAGICVCIFSSLLAFVLIFYLFVASFIARRLFRVSFHATNSVTSKTKRKRIDLFPWSSSSRAGRCTCRIYASPEEYNFT